MEYQNILNNKFRNIHHSLNINTGNNDHMHLNLNGYTNQTQKQAPMVQTVQVTLEYQMEKVQNLIVKKRGQEDKWNRISSASLDYRHRLKKKMQDDQLKHQKNRKNYLEKRVKEQKYKSQAVQQKREQLLGKRKEVSKNRDQFSKKFRSQTIQFWENKAKSVKQSYHRQRSAAPLYDDVIERKKGFQNNNIRFSMTTQQQLLARHNQAFRRKQKSYVLDNRPSWQEHNSKCQQFYQNNQEIVDKKQKGFISTIVSIQERSQQLLKKAKVQWNKKINGQLIDQQDHIDEIKVNRTQRNLKRAQSVKSCRCHQRGSIIKLDSQKQQNQNQQEFTNSKFNKSTLPLFTRSSFSARGSMHKQIVSQNKSRIRQRDEEKYQKKLRLEKQITDAVKNRKNILNQGNCILRIARVNA